MLAQQRPDFSGEWTLNLDASRLSPHVAAAAKSGTLRIEHQDPNFKCQTTIVLGDKPIDTKYEMVSDAHETAATHQDRRIVSSLRWEGDALVASWRIAGPNDEMTIVFRYELQSEGRRIRATETLRGGGRDQDNVWMFERQ